MQRGLFLRNEEAVNDWYDVGLPQTVFDTSCPPSRPPVASRGSAPSRRRRPRRSPGPGSYSETKRCSTEATAGKFFRCQRRAPLPAVSAHDLQNERSLVAGKSDQKVDVSISSRTLALVTHLVASSPLCGRHDGVDHLDDPVQRRVGADGHVCPAEVVVDGAHHAHDVKGRVFLHGVGFDQA